MKALVMLLAWGAAAGASEVSRVLDEKLTTAQRNDACFALRGNRSAEAVAAMRQVLENPNLRACAAANLRAAGAADALKSALSDPEAEVRAAAARELGALARPDSIELLAAAARDSNPLVAANAVAGLGQFEDGSALPYLLEIAKTGGVVGVAALGQAARFQAPGVLAVARQYLAASDVPAQLIALNVIGGMGDASDLPRLRAMAAESAPVAARGRGFGLLPAIDVARAAQNAISRIESRVAVQSPR